MAFALDFPQSVRGLVLMSGYFYRTARLEVPLASQPAIPVVGDLMRYTVSPLMFRMTWPLMLKGIFSPAEVPQHFKQFTAWMALRPSQLRASAAEIALIIPAVMGLRKRYHELKMPFIIMAGGEDRLAYVDNHSARLHSELPHSDFRLAQGVGHMVHHMVPDQVTDAIDSAAIAAIPGTSPHGQKVSPVPERLH